MILEPSHIFMLGLLVGLRMGQWACPEAWTEQQLPITAEIKRHRLVWLLCPEIRVSFTVS